MRPLERFFYVYGDVVARHPWPFIIIPTILTIISTYGMFSFHSQDDIWDIYAPLNAISRIEEKGLQPFEYASASHHYRMQILVNRKDQTNVLTMSTLDELYEIQQTAIATRGTSMSIRLTFPSAEAFQKRVFLGYSLGDLTFYKNQPNEIKEARLLILHYMVDTSLPNGKRLADDFESKLRRFFTSSSNSSPNLMFSLLSREREIEEQRNITIVAIPYLGLTVIVLIIFMLLTLIDFPFYRSQYLESLVGIFSPMMALWTSCGVLFWIGFPFTNILTVVPFLVVTIGIDDAFLLLAGWRQSKKGASLEQRMAESVSISGASITVTSVTGQAFMTFFTAVMSFIVRRQLHFDQKAIEDEVQISILLAREVNTDFDMENLYLEESPLTEISRRMQDFVLRESFVVNFAVQPMPNFSNESIRNEFEEMVTKLELIPNFGAGPNYTILWTRDYMNSIAFWGEGEDFWIPENLLKNYLDYGLEEKFIITKKNKSGKDLIDGFYFTIVYRNMTSFLDVEHLMDQRRSIIASYPSFHVLSHHPLEKVPTESAASAPHNFLQTAVSAVVLMSVLVLLFVMNWEAIISVVVSITSICLGIVAYLHLWDVRLDAVSLISILMSVGFSVDYSAHVCYHYFAHVEEDEHERIKEHTPSSTNSVASSLFPLIFVHAYVVAVFWKTVFLVGVLGMFHALLLLPTVFLLTDDVKRFFKNR
ncbi:patched family protein [Dictyocaulus viviparus]|uniref:Patched family protein n=1 Tax=Dictyocaulus viviparus TaxID=29172 RepID=A0A0D8Y3P2_DICVI|nr:patched family protein [Dictyocaulus viviparus]